MNESNLPRPWIPPTCRDYVDQLERAVGAARALRDAQAGRARVDPEQRELDAALHELARFVPWKGSR